MPLSIRNADDADNKNDSIKYFIHDRGERVVLQGLVALELAVEVAAKDCVAGEREACLGVVGPEDVFAQQ